MEGLSYEEIRKQRLEENKKRMQELGLAGLSKSLAGDAFSTKTPVTAKHAKPRAPKQSLNVELRRSSRVASSPAPDYREVDVEMHSARRGYSSRTASLLNRKYASDEARLDATLKAESVMKELPRSNPSFVKPMLQSHVTGGFWLGLPVSFCKTYLPKKDSKIVLENEKGEEWDTVYLAQKTGLSGGWRGFSLDHGLVDGDALVFELVEPLRFKIHIIRVEQSDEHEENNTRYASKTLNKDDDKVLKDKTDTNVVEHTPESMKENVKSEDDSESMKENVEIVSGKRGRPKKGQSPSPAYKSDADEKEDLSPLTRGRSKNRMSVEVSEKQKANRGGPKKEALSETKTAEEEEKSEDIDKKQQSTRRGRPRKEVPAEENSGNNKTQECVEKQSAKRGRPRKCQSQPAQESTRKRQRDQVDDGDDHADEPHQNGNEDKQITSFLRTQKPHTTRLSKKQNITSTQIRNTVKVC